MVAMGHGLCVFFCVCGETTKNKEESKIVNRTQSLYEFLIWLGLNRMSYVVLSLELGCIFSGKRHAEVELISLLVTLQYQVFAQQKTT